MGRQRLTLSLGAVAVLVAAAAALAATRPAGSVRQVGGKNGCYTSDGSSTAGPGTCQNIRGGGEATTLTLSPDGRFAYLVGYGKFTNPQVVPVLSVFHRNAANGVLSQLPGKSGCFSRNGSSEDGPGTCTNARNLDTGDATSIVISRDGRFLYVASQLNLNNDQIGGIAIFKRNLKTGKLRQLAGKKGCLSSDGSSEDGPGTCARAREVDYVSNLHITPDQRFLYSSAYGAYPRAGIAIFKRDLSAGTLHQLKGKNGCITGNGTTPRSGTSVVCTAMANVSNPWDIATPDNHFAYIPASTNSGGVNLVQAFKRNSAGTLVPLHGKGRCVSDTGTSPAGPCVDGRGLFRPERAVLSKNRRFLYISSYGFGDPASPSPLAVLNRNPKNGMLSERPGTAACISSDGNSGDEPGESCRNGRALTGGYAGMLSPDGTTLYFSEFESNALVMFRASPKTGAFHQLGGTFGCVTPDGKSEDGPGTCAKGRGINGPYQVALGSRGRDVYVTGSNANGVALFHAVR
jgi:hypothetical protein